MCLEVAQFQRRYKWLSPSLSGVQMLLTGIAPRKGVHSHTDPFAKDDPERSCDDVRRRDRSLRRLRP